jgi:hypothetical protein
MTSHHLRRFREAKKTETFINQFRSSFSEEISLGGRQQQPSGVTSRGFGLFHSFNLDGFVHLGSGASILPQMRIHDSRRGFDGAWP